MVNWVGKALLQTKDNFVSSLCTDSNLTEKEEQKHIPAIKQSYVFKSHRKHHGMRFEFSMGSTWVQHQHASSGHAFGNGHLLGISCPICRQGTQKITLLHWHGFR